MALGCGSTMAQDREVPLRERVWLSWLDSLSGWPSNSICRLRLSPVLLEMAGSQSQVSPKPRMCFTLVLLTRWKKG
jgi:hypothetical protein